MKRVHKSTKEPELLCKYRNLYPAETWEHFRRHWRKGYRQVKEATIKDQHGLCAYCEISIKLAEEENEVDDFRIEHFFPKSATKKDKHNYHLDWHNLLGVCHGGSQPYVPDAQWRFSAQKRDRSCDVPKGNKEITRNILNPLKIPANIRLFRYAEHTGRIIVDEAICPPGLQKKARITIKELNLNASRLMRMRKAVIQRLNEEISDIIQTGATIEEAASFLAESFLLPDDEGRYVSFFTMIRWYLGTAAEQLLSEHNYNI